MNMKIGVIKGDGIGPEIVDEAMKVLDRIAEVYGHSLSYTQLLMGGASIDANGVPLTEETLEAARESDAVLMGSIGGDAKTSPWYQLEPSKRRTIQASGGRTPGFEKRAESVCELTAGCALSGIKRGVPAEGGNRRPRF